ncbi:serine/threonine-protein kinase [Nocardia goodfellowii]|uniref:non-specific serine/threonine protein kinase n=1 Tax=Nocardia goodfellowii TaxID=882446 RepID=A0ABS4QCE3_9NOCA|nr:serine/threonine-protein kinase [Nocardia goodfellowii]MBP2189376.1 serine/threonine-protein kinase [Nocardia goodfellowii]
MLQAGEVFAGYVVKRVLGQGGMGTVYLAQHPRLPRLTALKLLDRELYGDDEIRRRFEREADLVAQLDHPNIVTVYDRGAEGDQLWISMQFVAGSDAASADVDALAPARAVHIISDTAAALDFAHANGVLHRDVKPANILLAKAPIGQPERVLLTDFGIAAMRNSDTTLSSVGQITATLAYAAPEQLSGTPMDHRSDQYSLACTLFWMLTGTPPFAGGNPAVVMNGHLFGPVPSLRQARPGLPPALDGVLARALGKRADERFASCTEFATAARQALASGGPQQHSPARPPQPGSYPGYPLPGARPPTGYTPPAHAGYGPQPTRPYAGSGPQPTGPYASGPQPTAANPGSPPQPIGPYASGPQPTAPYPGHAPQRTGPYASGPQPTAPYPGTPPQPTGLYPGNEPQSTRPSGNGPQPTGPYPGNGSQPHVPHTGYRPPTYPYPSAPPAYPSGAAGYTSGVPPVPSVPPGTGLAPNGVPPVASRPSRPGMPPVAGTPPISASPSSGGTPSGLGTSPGVGTPPAASAPRGASGVPGANSPSAAGTSSAADTSSAAGGLPASGGPATSGPVPARPSSGRNPMPPTGTESPSPVRPPSADPPTPSGSAAAQGPSSGRRRTVRPITIALPDAPIRRARPSAGEPGREP